MRTGFGAKIVRFQDRHAEAFRRLNLEWIEQYFVVERPDREQLDNPRAHILEPGGAIFIAEVDGGPVGTVAMLFIGTGHYELVKMAVTPDAQGQGIGRLLMDAAIQWARGKGGERITLLSHSKLVAATRLYEAYGFRHVDFDRESTGYSRCDIAMQLNLD